VPWYVTRSFSIANVCEIIDRVQAVGYVQRLDSTSNRYDPKTPSHPRAPTSISLPTAKRTWEQSGRPIAPWYVTRSSSIANVCEIIDRVHAVGYVQRLDSTGNLDDPKIPSHQRTPTSISLPTAKRTWEQSGRPIAPWYVTRSSSIANVCEIIDRVQAVKIQGIFYKDRFTYPTENLPPLERLRIPKTSRLCPLNQQIMLAIFEPANYSCVVCIRILLCLAAP
jgi:hypothetical protein